MIFVQYIHFSEIQEKKSVTKKKRKAYTDQEKASLIEKFLALKEEDENLSYSTFAELEQIPSKSMLFKWVNDKDEKGMNNILRRAYEGCNLKKYRPVPKKNPKHAKTHELLYKEHLEHRKRGNKISFYWYYITGKKIAAKNSLPPFTK